MESRLQITCSRESLRITTEIYSPPGGLEGLSSSIKYHSAARTDEKSLYRWGVRPAAGGWASDDLPGSVIYYILCHM